MYIKKKTKIIATIGPACFSYDRIKKIGGDGGLIAIDNKGNIAMPFNTDGMYRASWSKNGTPLVAIY